LTVKDAPNNYVYRMDHDTGFAPNTEYNICTLSGCKNSKNGKRKNIEESAAKGSWVIGIGGNKTGKPNKLIYAMEVEENLPYPEFRKKYSQKSVYLRPKNAGTNVLVSVNFYYFGNNAIDLPNELKHIIVDTHGCRCVSNKDVSRLKKYIEQCGYAKYGAYGEPNNPKLSCRNKNTAASACL